MKKELQEITEADLESFRKVMGLLPGISVEPSIALNEFVKEDEEYVKYNYGEKYLSSVKLSYKHLLKYFSPARKINTISIKDAELFIRSLRSTVPSGYTVYVRNIKAGFNRAITYGYLKENHFNAIKLERKQRNRPAVITESELDVICNNIKNKIIANAIRFDFYTGLRVGELVNLRWENVDIEKRILTVGSFLYTTKSKKQRFIPLCDKAIEALSPNLSLGERGKGYVFGKGSGAKYTTDCISKNFKRSCRATGIDERIHLHSVRASFATYLAEKGANAFQLKELLGHSSIVVSQIYTAVNIDSLRAAISKFN